MTQTLNAKQAQALSSDYQKQARQYAAAIAVAKIEGDNERIASYEAKLEALKRASSALRDAFNKLTPANHKGPLITASSLDKDVTKDSLIAAGTSPAHVAHHRVLVEAEKSSKRCAVDLFGANSEEMVVLHTTTTFKRDSSTPGHWAKVDELSRFSINGYRRIEGKGGNNSDLMNITADVDLPESEPEPEPAPEATEGTATDDSDE